MPAPATARKRRGILKYAESFGRGGCTAPWRIRSQIQTGAQHSTLNSGTLNKASRDWRSEEGLQYLRHE